MAAIRVGKVALRLVAPESLRGEASELRSRAEHGFVPALLQALAARLRQRYGPHAVLRIPALRLKLHMPASALEAAPWVERVCDDLAEQVQQWVDRHPPGRAPVGDRAAAQRFHDHAHEQAVRLVAAARRQTGPRGEVESFERLWAAVAAAPPRERAAVLLRCAEEEGAPALLQRWSRPELQQVLRRLPAHAPAAWVQAVRQALRERREATAPRRAARRVDDMTVPQNPVPAELEAEAPAPRLAQQTSTPQVDAPRSEPMPAPGAEPQVLRTAAPADAAAAPPARPHAAAPQAPEVPPLDEHRAAPAAPGPLPAPAVLAPPDAAPVDDTDADPLAAWRSRWCGLLYLLNLSQRLELPERLWQVGVNEGDALAAMLARMAGGGDDVLAEPALRLLSRAFPEAPAPVPPLPDWARDELMSGVAEAVARWPALRERGAELHARVAELQAWYGDGAAFDLAAWGAAWHQALAEALLDERLAPAGLAARFSGAGVIECEGEQWRVVQPLQAIDIDLRRAGLDADPGWLAWVGKRLVFVFDGPDPLHPPEP